MNIRLIFIALSALISLSNGYKVLVLAPFGSKSHFLYIKSVVLALLNRGHEVTYLTSYTLSDLKLANYTEYLVDPPFDAESKLTPDKLFNTAGSASSIIKDIVDFANEWNSHNMASESTHRLINSTGLHFDVIINEEFFADSFLMFAHKFKAPVVTIYTFGYPDYIDRQTGFMTPFAIAPHFAMPFSDKMSFFERFQNLLINIYDHYVRNYIYLPAEEEIARKNFGHLGPLPPLKDLVHNISIVLINTHRAFFPPRPMMPSVIPIGGAHLTPPKALPNELQTFLDGAKDGAIYFSLGTVIKTSGLPKEKIQLFLDALGSLKQRVLWKFEDESLSGVPPNMMIRKWMPQNDILAHPNVVLFIGHGGSFGTTESLYHGVPLLLIPFFSDQHRNAHSVERRGLGKFLSFGEMTKDSILEKVNEIITNKSFMERAKQTSAIFKDNLVHPMDEAIFWIEHVAKFKGAPHLQSHGVHMSWFSYLMLDVITVIVLGVSIVLYAFYYSYKKLLSKKKITQSRTKKTN